VNRSDQYQAIASSSEVARAAEDALAADTGSPLLGVVDVKVRSNVVTITASARDPERAAKSANAYASAVAQRLDAVYGVADQDQAALVNRLAEAAADHQNAEDKLAGFTRTNRTLPVVHPAALGPHRTGITQPPDEDRQQSPACPRRSN
jgi:hypothetical protein